MGFGVETGDRLQRPVLHCQDDRIRGCCPYDYPVDKDRLPGDAPPDLPQPVLRFRRAPRENQVAARPDRDLLCESGIAAVPAVDGAARGLDVDEPGESPGNDLAKDPSGLRGLSPVEQERGLPQI